MIKVMQHFADGGKVEWNDPGDIRWEEATAPCWDWLNYNYRIQPTKTKVPLTAQDFPPGTVIKDTQSAWDWESVDAVSKDCVHLSVGGMLTFRYLMIHCTMSVDGGKTWLPCYKEV